MPFVRISLRKGKSADYLSSLGAGVHQALVACFNTPEHDRFQVIEQYEPEHLIHDPDYLGVHRTDDIVFVAITAIGSRTVEMKRALYKAIVENLAGSPGVRREDVQVILTPNGREDWSFGNGVASYAPDEPER